MFELKFKMGNDAFFQPCEAPEIVRILRRLADHIEKTGDDSGKVLDSNGNIVGEYSFA